MKRPGIILVVVLVVAAMTAMIAVGLMFVARAEVAASAGDARGEQAHAAAVSGIQHAVAVLQYYRQDMQVWYDDPEVFQAQHVADDGADSWYFSVYAAYVDQQEETVRYGVIDEGGKLNLNTVSEEALARLQILTDDLRDCLLDYRDRDDEVRRGGAEQDYYDNLLYPYLIPNGPFATVEELFMVKGFNAEVVYGEDANFNGLLDPNEDDGDESMPPDNRDGRLDPGLRDLLTVYSAVPNVDREGRRRTDINAGPPRNLGLSQDTVRFIEIYLSEGNRFTHPSQLLEMQYRVQRANQRYRDVRPGDTIESGVGPDELPTVVDRLTVGNQRTLRGLVNVNTARPEVLAALPGLDINRAQDIVDVRMGLSPETKSTIAWLYTQNLVDADAFKEVAPLLMADSRQFLVRCVGFGVPCGRFRVLEAVVDLSGSTPRIAYLRDLTRLGLPFALDPESLERTR